MNRSRFLPALILIILVLLSSSLMAQVPSVIAYQGRLTSTNGTPLTGSYSLTFTIYSDPFGTTALWGEQQTAVPVTDGLFNVKLGSSVAFPADLFSSPNRYLGISVSHAAELQPLTRFTAVPYALNAGSISGSLGDQITLESSAGDVTTIGAGANVLSAYNQLGELRVKIGLEPAVSGTPEIGPIDGGGAVSIYDDNGDLRVRMGLDNPSSPSALARVIPIDGGGAVSFYRRASTRSGEAIYDKLAEFGEEGLLLFGATESDTTARLTSAGDLFSTGKVTFGSGSSSSEWGTTVFGINNEVNDSLGTISGGANSIVGTIGATAHTGGTIGGGEYNSCDGDYSVIGGGYNNTTTGYYATIPGGKDNEADANYTWAGGLGARSEHDGCFVWSDADTNVTPMFTSGQNQFLIKAGGGVGIQTNAPRGALDVNCQRTYAGYFDSDSLSSNVQVVKAEYTGTGSYHAEAVNGYSRPADGYGYGGYFEGGYTGLFARVSPTGSANYYGVHAQVYSGSGTNYGVRGYVTGSGTNYGLFGSAPGGTGSTNYGLYATASGGTASYAGYFNGGSATYAGYFNGNVHVNGTFTASSKSFKIDHPLDPRNQYLLHACVESPEMKNVYDGVIRLNTRGEATVVLPDYFEALNTDFRYQLTCIGGYAPVYITEKINGNRFVIAGGSPNLEVSWQVTGVRHDAYATAHPMQNEQLKDLDHRGKYLNPEAFGAPATMGEEYVNNQAPNEDKRE